MRTGSILTSDDPPGFGPVDHLDLTIVDLLETSGDLLGPSRLRVSIDFRLKTVDPRGNELASLFRRQAERLGQ
jgi:hypothetical protein